MIAGAVARSFLKEKFGTVILSSICQVGNLRANKSLSAELLGGDKISSGKTSSEAIESLEKQLLSNEIHSLDRDFANEAGELIKETRKAGNSIGASVEVVALNVPPLLGDPLYQSLKLKLMERG